MKPGLWEQMEIPNNLLRYSLTCQPVAGTFQGGLASTRYRATDQVLHTRWHDTSRGAPDDLADQTAVLRL